MAVIGVGPVGFAVAKALLQHGIPYEQLEADDDLGGKSSGRRRRVPPDPEMQVF
jgi:cation diffusion facilitator CzcD-associated flavoprotein CzcO